MVDICYPAKIRLVRVGWLDIGCLQRTESLNRDSEATGQVFADTKTVPENDRTDSIIKLLLIAIKIPTCYLISTPPLIT